ncbi:MAG TPA: acetyl-CoA carboxylase biotin carboxyl carrier protein [Allosphingosinicella sp.]|nr:acetyl-CoA carboxylase biotin carboxyl carrier protein [Allosphingosinicella sp.]
MVDKTASEGPMRVDTDMVGQLTELLNMGNLSEIEVQDGERRIVVKRQLTAAPAAAPAAAPPAPPAPAAAPAAAPPPATEDHPGAVKSPMVGTVYLSGEPGAAPFVSPGASVGAGDTLVIIEAMKVMNPITAPKAGVVRQVLVSNAQPVEFDQPLVIIE